VLKFIRRNAAAVWVKIMFLAIVLVFIIGFGIGGYLGGADTVPFAAKVNGERIEPVDAQRAYENMLRLYQNLYKDNFRPEMAESLDLRGKALDQLIRMALLRQEAERIGLRVSDSSVRDQIATNEAFQDNGRFDRSLYARVLRANRVTPAEFEASIREQLLASRMQELITDGVRVTEAEVLERYQFDNEGINLQFVKFDAPQFMDQVQVSDEQVQAYYDAHQDAFREPERVRIEYVEYLPDKYLETVEASDDEIQQYYAAHEADFASPEQVRARHILLKVAPDTSPDLKAEVRKKAEEILARARAGEDFATLAKEYSEDTASAQNGGDLGTFPRGRMVQSFEDAAFALEPGQISDVVESPFGFHIIKVEGKDEPHTQPLDAVRGEIASTLKHQKAREAAQMAAAADQAKVAGGEPLAAVAQARGLQVETPSPVAQTEVLPGVGSPALVNAAFATEAGKTGALVETPKGFFVFDVVERVPPHVPPLADIRDRVVAAARSEQARQLAKTKAEAFLADLQKAEKPDLAAAARAAGLTVDETGAVTRQNPFSEKLGAAPELMREGFKLTPEKPLAPAVYPVSGASVVAALKERVPADEAKFKEAKDNLMEQAQAMRRAQTMEAFVNELKARSQIELGNVDVAGRPRGGRRG
jgi:peptidyl-prolyl cis-trans isomerase D